MLATWLFASFAAWAWIIWLIVTKPPTHGRKPAGNRLLAALSLCVFAVGFSLPVPAVLLVVL